MARRKKKGHGEEFWLLVAVVGVAAVAVVWWFVRTYPEWAIGIGVLLLVAIVGGLFLRHRSIEADRRRFLAANTELARVDRLTGPEFERPDRRTAAYRRVPAGHPARGHR